jgi:hypothetical protein
LFSVTTLDKLAVGGSRSPRALREKVNQGALDWSQKSRLDSLGIHFLCEAQRCFLLSFPPAGRLTLALLQLLSPYLPGLHPHLFFLLATLWGSAHERVFWPVSCEHQSWWNMRGAARISSHDATRGPYLSWAAQSRAASVVWGLRYNTSLHCTQCSIQCCFIWEFGPFLDFLGTGIVLSSSLCFTSPLTAQHRAWHVRDKQAHHCVQ